MEVVEERKKLRDKVIEKALNWSNSLNIKVTSILIGSYAKGDFNLWSDVDILLISNEFNGSPINRLKALDPPSGFQIIPLTLNEFKKLLIKKNGLILDTAKFGIVLKDDLQLSPFLKFIVKEDLSNIV